MRRKNRNLFLFAFGVGTLFAIIIGLSFCDVTPKNKWEIKTEIQPKVLGKDGDDELSIQYNLGPFIILDDLDYLKASHQQYVIKNENVKLNLHITRSMNKFNNGFYYYIGGIKIGTRTNPMKLEKLQERADEIPGFKWFIRDGKTLKGDGELESEVIKGDNNKQMKRLE